MKTRAKMMAWVLLIGGTACVGGLLRLHEGQIQEQQPDGSWKCADQTIRDIVQGYSLSNYSLVDVNGWDSAITGTQYDIKSEYDPNTWILSDSFVRSLCEKGRVCQTMGHIWDWKWTAERDSFQVCRFCGADRQQIWIEGHK